MEMQFFELKPEHLKLMKRLGFQAEIYSPYGHFLTPAINAKRPFGNSGVLSDVCEIIGCTADSDGYYSVADRKRAALLLAELPLAIKFVLNTQNFTPGHYALDKDGFASHERFWQTMSRGYALMYEAFNEAKEKKVIPSIRDDDRVYSAAFNSVGTSDPFNPVLNMLEYGASDAFLRSIAMRPDEERERLTKEHQNYKELLAIFSKYHEEYLRDKDEAFNKAINRFDGEYAFLSNFYDFPVSAHGISYQNSEAAFQAQKCEDVKDRLEFRTMTAREAKKAGRKVKLRQHWDGMKDDEMLLILRNKFSNPEMAEKLLDTGNRELVEGNYWHDNYWGNCTCEKCRNVEGKNKLGQMLMVIRDEQRSARKEKLDRFDLGR